MTPLVQSVTDFLSLLTLAGGLFVVVMIVFVLLKRLKLSSAWMDLVVNFFGKRVLVFSFVIALGSMVSSLFYSEVAGFLPCLFCWWIRVFFYPQVFILAIALWKKDFSALIYTTVLSLVGTLIAGYHTFIQFGGSPLIPCLATGVSCAQRFFLEYGYITIPTMALTGFLMMLVMGLAYYNSKEEEL